MTYSAIHELGAVRSSLLTVQAYFSESDRNVQPDAMFQHVVSFTARVRLVRHASNKLKIRLGSCTFDSASRRKKPMGSTL